MSSFMNLFFKSKDASAETAKDRVKAAVAGDRNERRHQYPYLADLKIDMLNTLVRYIPVTSEQIQWNFNQSNETAILSVNIPLPSKAPLRQGGHSHHAATR